MSCEKIEIRQSSHIRIEYLKLTAVNVKHILSKWWVICISLDSSWHISICILLEVCFVNSINHVPHSMTETQYCSIDFSPAHILPQKISPPPWVLNEWFVDLKIFLKVLSFSSVPYNLLSSEEIWCFQIFCTKHPEFQVNLKYLFLWYQTFQTQKGLSLCKRA